MKKENYFEISNQIGELNELETNLRTESRNSKEHEKAELLKFANKLNKFRNEIETYFMNLANLDDEIGDAVYRNLEEEENGLGEFAKQEKGMTDEIDKYFQS